MLAIQKYLHEHGLDKTISDFNLICKDAGHKVLLKYNQIESDMSKEEVQDSRGIILEKGSWNIMCLSFRKFFNYGESNAHKIDWTTARVLDKADGSLIQLYYDYVIEDWCVATSGTPDGNALVNNKTGLLFKDLFWDTIDKVVKIPDWCDLKPRELLKNNLIKGCVYVFELCTPYNIVVTPHKESKVYLLTIRDLSTLRELHEDVLKIESKKLGLPLIKSYSIKADANEIVKSFDEKPYYEEGYIVVDINFNRVKIKNPSYVAMHHLKGSLAEWRIIILVKKNEVDEYISSFPEREDEIRELELKYNKFISFIGDLYGKIKLWKFDSDSQKEFALKIQSELNEDFKYLQPFAYQVGNGKINDYKEWIKEYDDRDLYYLILKGQF